MPTTSAPLASAPACAQTEALAPDWSQLQPGFADPVHDAQRVFRALLDALARPGQLRDVGVVLPASNEAGIAARAALLALADAETPVWLQRPMPALSAALRFHTGAPVLSGRDAQSQAHFALLTETAHWPALDAFSLGSLEAPEHSTTLLIDVTALAAGWHSADGVRLRLRGPGVAEHADVTVHGLPSRFWAEHAALAPQFPCGLDLWLAAGATVLGVPRTTRVEVC
ncbi:phosphonate C-P lyase system protein PhnH [Pandoraea terrae]|uniref:Phosphonate C-P lyase system protein PhnH n=1 Tax=Pandoraea terrae TaxID=1537710 RepID=A0A5E4WDD3_9BURK|nr:phosphonate C-P lyase system protein PhnH [Pandoraea terrae]VVE22588.1 phosphonate C-P lyase system protein PhnH [Pandoraea terrae]